MPGLGRLIRPALGQGLRRFRKSRCMLRTFFFRASFQLLSDDSSDFTLDGDGQIEQDKEEAPGFVDSESVVCANNEVADRLAPLLALDPLPGFARKRLPLIGIGVKLEEVVGKQG